MTTKQRVGHTAGPWVVSNSAGDLEIYTIDGTPLADIYSPNMNDNVMKANAALIASAPELLEACKNAIDWLTELEEDKGIACSEPIQALYQAINHAEGKA